MFSAKPEISHVDIFEKHSYESVPLKYEVIAHGIPKPEAIWYLKGEEIKADSRTSLISEGVKIIRGNIFTKIFFIIGIIYLFLSNLLSSVIRMFIV